MTTPALIKNNVLVNLLVWILCSNPLQVNACLFIDPVIQADELMDHGKWNEAIDLLESIHAEAPESLGAHAYGNVISNLGYAYWQNGAIEKSRHYLVKAVNYKRENGFVKDPSYIKSLKNLAQVLRLSGRYDEARIFFIEVINLLYDRYGVNNYQYALGLSSLADFYHEIGLYKKSYELYNQAFNIVNILFSQDSPEFGEISVSLGRILMKVGSFDEAEHHLEHAVSVFSKRPSDHQLKYVQSLESLGVLKEIQGKYGEAEKILLDVLEYKQTIHELDPESLIKTLNELGIIHQNIGNLEKAAHFFSQVKEKCEENLHRNHSYYAIALNNLATIAKQKHAYEKAKALFSESLKIYAQLYGEHHPLYADGLNNLASTESKLGQLDLAEKHYRQVLALDSVIYGVEHQHYATTLNNLGILLFKKGENEKAEVLYLQSLEIRKNTLGINHPTYARSLENLGLYHYSRGNLLQAEKFFREAVTIRKKQIRTIFPVLTEKERQIFYETISQDIERYNHIALSLLNSNPELIENIINNQIQTKAILLNASEKIRQSIINSRDQQLIEDYKTWVELKTRLVRYYHVGQSRLAENGINLKALESRIEDIEKRIIHQRGSFEILSDINVTWHDIQQNLANGEVVIEIVRIRDFDQDKAGKNLIFGFSEMCKYLAIIVNPNKPGPEYVIVPDGVNLEKAVYACYKNSLHFKVEDKRSFISYWQKIDEKLSTSFVSRVFVSPDGIYNKINPNTFLMGDGTYVIDKYFVNYLTNCSDLLPKKDPAITNKRAYLIGDPEFHLNGKNQLLTKLPGTNKEINQIKNILNDQKDWSIITHTQEEASEYHLKESDRPGLLHIATHGFLADEDKLATALLPVETHNMFKSGMYLAGVENSYYSHQSGLEYDPFNDGVLTAYEAMNLNLEGTEMVILSACYTGGGDVVNGEGVYGLQRAFIVAGASNLILSLTAIDDDATEKLMTYFYENFKDDQPINLALRNAQLKLRTEYSHPHYWGSFMLVGRGSRI